MIKIRPKHIILTLIAVILLAALIPANIIINSIKYVASEALGGVKGPTISAEVSEQGDALVYEITEDSAVLLRNENNALPLKASETKVNLFGFGATDDGFLLTGKGSGGTTIHEDKKVTLIEAFTDAGFTVNDTLVKSYNDWRATAGGYIDADVNSKASMRPYNPGADFYTDDVMSQAKGYSDVAIVLLNRYTGENSGSGEAYNTTQDGVQYNDGAWLELTTEERAMFEAIAAKNFGKVIVLLNTTNVMECGFLEDADYGIDAAMYIGLPGQSGARAIPGLLRGEKTVENEDGTTATEKVSPSGRLADTYAYDHQTNDPSVVNVTSSSIGLHYAEDIYVGYKWYETADAEGYFDSVDNEYGSGYDGVVQYPFGYGLSYTTFDWEVLDFPTERTMTYEDEEFSVRVKVTNTGSTPGKDVVQLYYTPPYTDGGVEKAHMNLLAFGKTETLYPEAEADGETKLNSQVLTLTFSSYDMASYDAYDKNRNDWAGWELDAGSYQVRLMKNAHEAATCENSVIEFEVTNADDGIFYVDPDNEDSGVVMNRFTGEDAYAGVPIDGSTVLNGATYLSREDGFANYPSSKVSGFSDSGAVSTASTYRYDGYDGVSQPVSSDTDHSLMLLENGSKPSAADLDGSSGAALKYNDELFDQLADYDSPVWDELIGQMSDDEVRLLVGAGGFQTEDILSIGKPRVVDRDGPAGFNNGVTNASAVREWTAYPVEALTGCSWNAKLMFDMGRAQGAEAKETNLNGWYAPGINLHRSPYNTRNFEYYSEDAVLSGDLAANLIYGAKTNNLYCYMKHFAASEAGQNPSNWNTWLTEQALRELYLKPFEIAVKDGGSNAIMSAFNRVGAVWAGSNHALSTEILRDEWGFRGSMITDWYSSGYMDYTRGVLAGNDLWLNANGNTPASLDMSNNAVAFAARRAAKNILYTFVDTYVTARDYEPSEDDRFAIEVGTMTAQESPQSPLFIFLWVLVNVLFVLGALVCIFFAFFFGMIRNKKKVAAASPTDGGSADGKNT